MNCVYSIIAVSVASSVVVMLTAGGKYEKLCTSLCSAAIALCALSPLCAAVSGDPAGEALKEAERLEAQSADELADACVRELERRTERAVAEKFPNSYGVRVTVETDRSDLTDIVITEVRVAAGGVGGEELRKFVSDLLCCEKVIAEGVDLDGY